ncbi:MAG TPA: heavy-metal-associated domain-containing protein [Clostridia bacterium]|nr:heavy-metal-associated domain-containing protein [Clostridia bacterium]
MNNLKLKISGMHCGACVRRVSAALEKVPGVRLGAVEVGSASVEYDPAQSGTQAIRAAVEKIGFAVESVQE